MAGKGIRGSAYLLGPRVWVLLSHRQVASLFCVLEPPALARHLDTLQVVHISGTQTPTFHPLPLLPHSGIFPSPPDASHDQSLCRDPRSPVTWGLVVGGLFPASATHMAEMLGTSFGLTCTGHGEETHTDNQDVAGRCHCPKESSRVKKCPLPCSLPLL